MTRETLRGLLPPWKEKLDVGCTVNSTKNEVVKIIFYGLSLEICYRNMNPRLDEAEEVIKTLNNVFKVKA